MKITKIETKEKYDEVIERLNGYREQEYTTAKDDEEYDRLCDLIHEYDERRLI